MLDKEQLFTVLLKKLKSLIQYSFPVECTNCGRVYATLDQYLSQSEVLPQRRSRVTWFDHNDNSFTDIHRNYHCGSRLRVVINERRDKSESGIRKREIFDQRLKIFIAEGLETHCVRQELLKISHGEESEILKKNLNGAKLDEISHLLTQLSSC